MTAALTLRCQGIFLTCGGCGCVNCGACYSCHAREKLRRRLEAALP